MALPNSNLLVSGTGAVFIQNLAIQGNSIIATNENGSIDFVPNGSGVIGFGNVGFNIGVISTTLENQDLTLNPDGNGNILLLPYGPGNVGIGTNSPSETLDLVGTFQQQDVLTRFIRKSLSSVGAPFNGLKGYILLAKAATPTSVNMAASYVVGKIIFKNGNTTTESFTEVFNVASSRGYDKENFSISIEHNGYGSGNSRFNRLVKCTYDSVEYHAIETSSVGSSNSHEQTFEGYAVDAGLLFVDENYVIAVSDYGNIGIVSNGDSNIGVGTVSTTAHFDIGTNDDGRIQAILTRGNDVDFQLQAINSSSSNASGSIVSKFGVRHGTNESALFNFIRGNFGNDGSLAIVTDNAERMRIDSVGNVGIGISSPAATLDISGSRTNGRSLQLRSGDGGGGSDTDSAQIIFSYNNASYDNSGYAHSIKTRHNGSAASGNAIDFWLWNHGVDTTSTLGSLRVMTLDGTGNVGIGTNSPQGKLHISGGAGNCVMILEADTDNNNEADNPAIWFKQDGGITESSISMDQNRLVFNNNVNNSGGFAFYTGTTNNTGTTSPFTGASEIMTITTSGNVGIGTSSPSAALHVATGDIKLNAYDNGEGHGIFFRRIISSAPGDGTYNMSITSRAYSSVHPDGLLMSAYDGIGFATGMSNTYDANYVRMLINGNGNVGIGTTSPAAKLDVYKDYNGQSAGTTAALLGGIDSGVGWSGVKILEKGSGLLSSDTYVLNAVVNTSSKFIVTGEGNVGIGTSIPTAKLDVRGSIRADHLTLGIENYPTLGGNWLSIYAPTFDSNIGDNAPNPEGGILFTNRSSGNVFPWGFYMGAVKYAAASNSTTTRFDIGTSTLVGTQLATTSYSNTLSPQMSIDAYGNVGIGTTSPTEKLEIAGKLKHQGLTLNEGTTPNVDEIKTFTKNLSISTTWSDTGISGADLATGSYIIQLYDNHNGVNGLDHWSMYFTGFMSWFGTVTNSSNDYNEILLHNAGHDLNGDLIYLRTMMVPLPGFLKLQIRCSSGVGSGDFIFKFRRMI